MAEEAAKEDEPTMEEILASIRRIISEDGDEVESAEATETEESAEAAEAAEPAEEPEAPAEPEANGQDAVDDILELTEEVEDEPEPEPDPEPEPEAETAPEPEPEPEPATEEDAGDRTAAEAVLEEGDSDRLVSDDAEEKAKASFAELSALLVAGYEGSGNTLEGLVRELLKPMLRSWLDENLPRIVEDAVEREVARISRRDR